MRNYEFCESNCFNLPKQMGARNQEVRPVGAWAQPASDFSLDAVEMASQEEQRLLQLQMRKAASLKKFQEDVKYRVKTMNKVKQQQWLDKSSKALITAHDFISQSSAAAVKSSVCQRSCCIMHSASDLNIKRALQSGNETVTSKQFLEQMIQVRQLHCHARSSLATKQENSGQNSTLDDFSKTIQSESAYPPDENEGQAKINRQINMMPYDQTTVPYARYRKSEKWSEQQRATCRRFFMDIERELVKRNIQQKEHLEKMALLKKTKEVERLDLEQLALMSTESSESLSSHCLEDRKALPFLEMELPHSELNKLNKWRQKMKQTDRYLTIMKRNFKDKMEKLNIEPVQMCLCGSSLWDTNPLTCANNCNFYQNPMGFAKAMQSLLSSFLTS